MSRRSCIHSSFFFFFFQLRVTQTLFSTASPNLNFALSENVATEIENSYILFNAIVSNVMPALRCSQCCATQPCQGAAPVGEESSHSSALLHFS